MIFLLVLLLIAGVSSACKEPITQVYTLANGVDPRAFANRKHFVLVGPAGPLPNAYEFEIGCADGHPGGHTAAVARMRLARRGDEETPEVVWRSDLQTKRTLHPRSSSIPTAQWHLQDTFNDATAHVIGVWRSGTFGSRSTVAIVDDGLDWSNNDLRPHFSMQLSHNFNSGNANDPTPSSYSYAHGTAAAGVAASAGRGGPPFGDGTNPMCGYGVAPNAALAGIKLIAEPVSDVVESRALSYLAANISVYSCSWGPYDDGLQLEGPGPLAAYAIEYGVCNGRDGLGSVYAWAAGNGAEYGDSCAYDGYASNPNVIAVAALSRQGTIAPYSEPCPAVFVSAPSSGNGWGITTTSVRATGCRSDFGGTSAAAPFVAGVIALVLDAEPTLTSKEVDRILVASARSVDPTHNSWHTNGIGVRHSAYYGFGAIDADAAVQIARAWRHDYFPVAPAPLLITVDGGYGGPIGQTSTVFATSDGIVERVVLTVSVTHRRRGQLSFTLVSPAGTSVCIQGRSGDRAADYANWKFTYLPFWGENIAGPWTLRVVDTARTPLSGTLNSFGLTFMGRQPN